MSIWNGFLKALGFSSEDEEDENEYDSSVPTYAVKHGQAEEVEDTDPDCRLERRPRQKPADAPAAPEPPQEPEPVTAGDLPGDIFDAVIEVFNATMPEFVSSSLQQEKQRKYIYDHISRSVRARMESMGAAKQPDTAAEAEHQRQLDIAAEAMRQAKEEIEKLRENLKKAHTDAERQKRALTDRITDLDRQLQKTRSEKERLLTSRKGDHLVERSEVEEKDAKIAEIQAALDEAQAEAERQKLMKEQLEVKTQMTDAMINDLRNEGAKLREELDHAKEDLMTAMEIQKQLEQFEQVKERKDAKIAELTQQVKSLTEQLEKVMAETSGNAQTVDGLTTENASLRSTIETNLYNQANSELKLRNEIKELRAQLEKALADAESASAMPSLLEEKPAAYRPGKRRRGRQRRQAVPEPEGTLDDNLAATDWLDVPEDSRKFDPDFGYHEPPRREVPKNDAQLSLF